MKRFLKALLLALVISLLKVKNIEAPQLESERNFIIIQGSYLKSNIQSWYLEPKFTILATVSAYSELETCPNRKCITASGKIAREDIIACPSWIPLGTKVEIDGEIYECGDRTHKRYDGRFDKWMGYGYEGYLRAKEFGIKTKEVIVLQ